MYAAPLDVGRMIEIDGFCDNGIVQFHAILPELYWRMLAALV
jgi:hypothetical protein